MFVYVIGWDASGPVKIGISRDVQARQAALQCSMPFPCFMLFWVNCGDRARKVESAAHRSAADKRLYGEWFDMSPAAAISLLQEISGLGSDSV